MTTLKVNHISERLGDTILIEPALSAYATRSPKDRARVDLYVNPVFRSLFKDHPHIRLVDGPHEEPDLVPDASEAFATAIALRLPFAAGYFPQVLSYPRDTDRFHFHAQGKDLKGKVKRNEIIIAPYARSCASHQGNLPNITAPLEWWTPIIKASPLPVVSLGGNEDQDVSGTFNLRGKPLRDVLLRLHRCKVFISVETGLLHLASATKSKTIFLSSATPEWFAKPDTRCEVIRATSPLLWDQAKVIEALKVLWEGN